MDPMRERLAVGGVFRAAALRDLAAEHRLCPFEVGLGAAGLDDVTVCDFNYAFHPHFEFGRRRQLNTCS